jgi:hypothetical protein
MSSGPVRMRMRFIVGEAKVTAAGRSLAGGLSFGIEPCLDRRRDVRTVVVVGTVRNVGGTPCSGTGRSQAAGRDIHELVGKESGEDPALDRVFLTVFCLVHRLFLSVS